MERDIRFTSKSRKHKIGKAHALFVMENNEPLREPGIEDFECKLLWTGFDDRGLELEIVGVEFETEILIIHAMPLSYRRRGRSER